MTTPIEPKRIALEDIIAANEATSSGLAVVGGNAELCQLLALNNWAHRKAAAELIRLTNEAAQAQAEAKATTRARTKK